MYYNIETNVFVGDPEYAEDKAIELESNLRTILDNPESIQSNMGVFDSDTDGLINEILEWLDTQRNVIALQHDFDEDKIEEDYNVLLNSLRFAYIDVTENEETIDIEIGGECPLEYL
jgi:hypothetical protein